MTLLATLSDFRKTNSFQLLESRSRPISRKIEHILSTKVITVMWSRVSQCYCLLQFYREEFSNDEARWYRAPPNLTSKFSTMSPGNPFILGSKGQRSRSWGTTKLCRRGSWRSGECWFLLVCYRPRRIETLHVADRREEPVRPDARLLMVAKTPMTSGCMDGRRREHRRQIKTLF